MTVSADPSPEPGELEQQVQAVIIAWESTWPVSRAGEVIRIVREAVAKEIEVANRAARFGITGARAVEVARKLPPVNYRGRGA